jgi:hypothetical protein
MLQNKREGEGVERVNLDVDASKTGGGERALRN